MYKNLVDLPLTGGAQEIFQHTRDFVCSLNGIADYTLSGLGWTLHDSFYAVDSANISGGDYVIFFSTGELGNERIYLRLYYYSNLYMLLNGYLSWDNITHTGTGYFGITTYSIDVDPAFRMYIYGDLDNFSLLVDYLGTYTCFGSWGGKADFPWPHDPHTVAASLTAGTDVDIVIDDTSGLEFSVGQPLFITDYTNIEKTTIKANNGSTTLTVDLVNSYTAGSVVRSWVPFAVDAYSTTFMHSTAARVKGLIGPTGIVGESFSGYVGSLTQSSSNDPNSVFNYHIAAPHCLGSTIYGSALSFPNMIYFYNRGTLILNDVLIDSDGVNWRVLSAGGYWIGFKEI